MAGYSKKSLSDKLGIKPEFKSCVLNATPEFIQEVALADFHTNWNRKIMITSIFLQRPH